MAMGEKYSQMAIYMKDDMRMVSLREKGSIFGKAAYFTRGSLLRGSVRGKGCCQLQTAYNSKEISSMTESWVMVA
jgi:hypothetical protein